MQTYCDSETKNLCYDQNECVQCLYYVLYSKQKLYNACTMFDCGSNTCAMSNAESRMMLLKQSKIQIGTEHMCCLCFHIKTNACAMSNDMNDKCAKSNATLGVMQ